MKVKSPKCPNCGDWMYIQARDNEEERVDVPPITEIYWTCDCGRVVAYPLEITSVLEQTVVVEPRKGHNVSFE